jgi:hypothetical protein
VHACGAETSFEDVTIGAVAVADEAFRRLFPAADFMSWRAIHSAPGCAAPALRLTPQHNELLSKGRLSVSSRLVDLNGATREREQKSEQRNH